MAPQTKLEKKHKFREIIDSDRPIPSWLTPNIAGTQRIWGRTILNYPLKFLRPSYESGNNPRLNPYKGIELIANKIRKYGFVGSVPVTPIMRDRTTGMIIYEIISGDRRFLALKNLRETSVNIQIYEGSEKEIAPLRMALNMESEVHQADQAIYIHRILINRFNYTHEQIAEICSQSSRNVGRTWVTLMAGIAQSCTKAIMDAWREEKIKKSHVILIARYFSKHDVKKQKRLLKFIIKEDIKAGDLKRRLLFATSATSAVNIHKLKQGIKRKKPTLEEESKNDNLGLDLASLVKHPKKTNKKKHRRSKIRTTFEIVQRYKQLKDLTESSDMRQTLLEEYEWILQTNKADHRCLLN